MNTETLPVQLDNAGTLQIDEGYVSAPHSEYPLKEILQTLRRRWKLPLFGCLIGLALGISYVAYVQTPYKSTARILIDGSVNRYLQTNKIVDQPSFDATEIGSQVYVLSSDSVVVPVVRSMNLAHDIEFVGPPRVKVPYLEYFNGLVDLVKETVGWSSAHSKINPESMLERTAVEAVLKRLTVYREDVANVINISFESQDANKAASIANALADTYIATTLEAKLNSTKVVSEWLQDRLAELKSQVAEADQAVQNYRTANNLVNTSGNSRDYDQLASLNTQLTNARISVAESKDRLDRVERAGDGIATAMVTDSVVNQARSGLINFAMNNSDLVKLRAQYRDLMARAADIESTVGPNHSVAVKLRTQIEAVKKEIRTEEMRLVDAYSNEYELAKVREGELSANVAELEAKGEAKIKLRELESSATTLSNLYNDLLQKFREVSTAQTETIPADNARIISKAAPQLQKSVKKPLAIVAGGLMLGLLLGAGTAVAREWAVDVLRTPTMVRQLTDRNCVVLPMVNPKSRLMEEYVLDAPYTRFTESLRNLKTLLDGARSSHGAKVIGVVSSVPNEGKTVVAANLAALLVASSGARTLIVDSDLHLRKLTAALAPGATEGVIEALENPSRLSALVSKRERSGLDVLPCVSSGRIPNAAEYLGSPRMEELLAEARKSYDFIIIEIAPILSVVDVKMIERHIDAFVFVVEWGRTGRNLVVEALSDAHVIHDRVLGVVLNKADSVASRRGIRGSEYYQL
jgi:succinoglycan biosynthesis transport protein ExoP